MIEINNNDIKINSINSNHSHLKNIVLLLESPHKDEYRSRNIYTKLIPIAPAQGENKLSAGGAIFNYLSEVLKFINEENHNIIPNGNFNLIISNPVQFQTSLVFIHGKPLDRAYQTLRDTIWKKIWDIQDIQSDFIKRINKYNPHLIINSCTKNLKPYVNEVLENLHNNTVINIKHPSFNWSKGEF